MRKKKRTASSNAATKFPPNARAAVAVAAQWVVLTLEVEDVVKVEADAEGTVDGVGEEKVVLALAAVIDRCAWGAGRVVEVEVPVAVVWLARVCDASGRMTNAGWGDEKLQRQRKKRNEERECGVERERERAER